MRWFVEIAPAGASGSADAELKKLVVDAPSWQSALGQVRTAFGDDVALASLTIEVLADGYRATNPTSRVRYLVTRAPDDAPPSELPKRDDAPPSSSPAALAAASLRRNKASGETSPPAPAVDSTSAPASPGADASRPAGMAPAPKRTETLTFAKPQVAASPEPTNGSPRPVAAQRAGAQTQIGLTPFAQGAAAAAAASPVAAAPHAVLHTPASIRPPGRVIARRDQDATASSPITYRELAIAVSPAFSKENAAEAGRAHLGVLVRELDEARAPSGRLIKLAVFDHEWSKKPEREPLVTITYKDWRGAEPEVRFPGAPAMPSPSPVVAAPAPAPSPVVAAPAPAPAPVVAAPSPSPVVAPPAPVVVAPAPAPVVAAPAPAPVVDVPAVAASAPVVIAPAPAPVVAPPVEAEVSIDFAPMATPPPKPAAAAKPKAAARRPDDLMTDLFEAAHDLNFLRNALDGVEFVLELLRTKIPTHVAFAHLYDINRNEWVLAKARAPNVAVVGARTKENEGLIGVAAKGNRPLLIEAETDARWSRSLYVEAGWKPTQILVAPIRHGSRYLGVLELADHLDGGALGEPELHALAYLAEQLAEFLADRAVILGADSTGSVPVLESPRRP
jgi:hypothetical protein